MLSLHHPNPWRHIILRFICIFCWHYTWISFTAGQNLLNHIIIMYTIYIYNVRACITFLSTKSNHADGPITVVLLMMDRLVVKTRENQSLYKKLGGIHTQKATLTSLTSLNDRAVRWSRTQTRAAPYLRCLVQIGWIGGFVASPCPRLLTVQAKTSLLTGHRVCITDSSAVSVERRALTPDWPSSRLFWERKSETWAKWHHAIYGPRAKLSIQMVWYLEILTCWRH